MKGSTSCRRFCWLQVNFSYEHEAAASQVPINGCSPSWLPIIVRTPATGSRAGMVRPKKQGNHFASWHRYLNHGLLGLAAARG
jgi:hypothetical protein